MPAAGNAGSNAGSNAAAAEPDTDAEGTVALDTVTPDTAQRTPPAAPPLTGA